MADKPKYDIVFFGATSFVGKIFVHEFAQALKNETPLRWAIAGRSEHKLSQQQQKISANHDSAYAPEIIVADAHDENQLLNVCQQTRVVISSVGPFALYGEKLVSACCQTGTDYCDLTGETQWVLQMLSRYQEAAITSGARLIPCCGFDAVPSDLGVYYVQQHAHQHFQQACIEINTRITQLKGKFSGGTYASIFNLLAEVSENPSIKKAITSPYCFCPSDHPYRQKQVRHQNATYDEKINAWIAPFIMEFINSRIVHRSNALLNHRYGTEFLYDEALATGGGRKGRKRASKITYGLWGLMLCGTFPWLRQIVQRWFLPKPGEGPTPEEQKAGGYEMEFFGRVPGRGSIQARLTGDMDPGYGSTAKILTQTALCLAVDTPKPPETGGFWTPASLFGEKLIKRLEESAGITFSIESVKKR